ncbi:hypothetical protein ACJIZ3_017135 [Penstemon smallii]|uniref:S-protein homolog n=1 Tax=Penstemon smallii TaxID=265156 RepID=A0ABD3SVV8_9LAMI
MNHIASFLAITFTTILVLCASQIRGNQGNLWLFGLKYHVHIVNGMEINHSNPLIVHCQSKEDDIGEHSLQLNQEITWHFKVRFDGSTLFYCDVKQDRLTKHFDAFDATIGGDCAGNGQCYCDNSKELIVRCKSADDDLGERSLDKDGEWKWNFRVNFFRSTLFYCNVKWGEYLEKSFNVFDTDYISSKCEDTSTCFWSVRDEGIYFSCDNVNYVKQHNWS